MRSSIKRLFSRWKLDNVKVVRRVIVSVVGATVLLIGIALLVLPGPAFVVIPVGSRFSPRVRVGRRWLRKVRRIASDVVSGRSHGIRDLVSSSHRGDKRAAAAWKTGELNQSCAEDSARYGRLEPESTTGVEAV